MSNLNKKYFEPYIVTLYSESDNSIIDKFKRLGTRCFCAETNKKNLLLGKNKKLRKIIDSINPDVIHSHGVFPDYAASMLKTAKHIITLHCFMREDYVNEYGWLRGRLLEWIQLRAIKKADKTIACSQSLAKKYYDKYNLKLDYILNGIDFSKYNTTCIPEKTHLKNKLGLPSDKIIVVYAARFIKRKNQAFLCDVFSKLSDDEALILLGKGPDYSSLKKEYENNKNIFFIGYKENLTDYLMASDVYISPSKSEGMPAGALEALACGLPVILSDIPPHKEILNLCSDVGFCYSEGDVDDCIKKIKQIGSDLIIYNNIREKAFKTFSAEVMSKNYQAEYLNLASNER